MKCCDNQEIAILEDPASDGIDYEFCANCGAQPENQARDTVWAKWEAADRKCECGTPIEFEDAYQHGECLACLQKSQLEDLRGERL